MVGPSGAPLGPTFPQGHHAGDAQTFGSAVARASPKFDLRRPRRRRRGPREGALHHRRRAFIRGHFVLRFVGALVRCLRELPRRRLLVRQWSFRVFFVVGLHSGEDLARRLGAIRERGVVPAFRAVCEDHVRNVAAEPFLGGEVAASCTRDVKIAGRDEHRDVVRPRELQLLFVLQGPRCAMAAVVRTSLRWSPTAGAVNP
mmetsp:Transcript_85592/g.261816  ORF Transcript_85592/g.261816 Transcript_85592/m.261816 type:complete len:201 (+) Transcript_85592:794-1396(+)